jgi:hypothetical protein
LVFIFFIVEISNICKSRKHTLALLKLQYGSIGIFLTAGSDWEVRKGPCDPAPHKTPSFEFTNSSCWSAAILSSKGVMSEYHNSALMMMDSWPILFPSPLSEIILK